ncbi:type I phosphomannose isomerase catalytic subunit [Clostridium ihumii]|uniref:type I phosphomannose isomerase catalytic subunit n=1 Tax=Clostridium ihumii TaxID=1470356 RepID=UPI00059173BB|nr:type I phosphomannose isomerase catalytic subunit [Clostridium ihumii]
MYPLKFKSIYLEKIWGGRGLEEFKLDVPQGEIGESWEISCHEDGKSVVTNGIYEGKTLKEVIEIEKEALIGKKINCYRFPILIKFITATDDLSIQVHPDQKYAEENENDNGKNECWYILKNINHGKIVVGINVKNENEFQNIIKNNEIEKKLNYIEPHEGEVYYIKSGLVHAIGKGITLLEIQQNSNLTYRIYDYDRGRKLHVDKALDVVNLNIKCNSEKYSFHKMKGYNIYKFKEINDFIIEKYEIEKLFMSKSDEDRFEVYICIEGKGIITYSNGTETIKMGDSIMIPAQLGEYAIVGNIQLIKVKAL